MSKRTVYLDGWHQSGKLEFYVENGRLIRGVWADSERVSPYQYDKRLGCLVNASGIRATCFRHSGDIRGVESCGMALRRAI